MGAIIAKLCQHHEAIIKEGSELATEVKDVIDAAKDKDVGDVIKNVGEAVNQVEDIVDVLKDGAPGGK